MTELAAEHIGTFSEADRLLGYIRAAALEASIDLPTKQYVTSGQAVHDCEQVAATVLTATTGMPASATPGGQGLSGACPPGWQVSIELAIVRCRPTPSESGAQPSAEKLSGHAKVQAGDTHILMSAADSRASERFGQVTCAILYPPPSGKFAATIARLTVAVSV